MKRKTMWAIVAVLFTVAIAYIFIIDKKHTVSISESTIQEQINKQVGQEYPVVGLSQTIAKSIQLKQAQVELRDDLMSVNLSILAKFRFDLMVSIDSKITGRPVFHNGAFYFKPEEVKIGKITYQGSTITDLTNEANAKFVSDEKLQKLLSTVGLKTESLVSSLTEQATSSWLTKNPIYEPADDFKGTLIKASLTSCDIVNGELVATFTLLRLTKMVFVGIGLLIISGIITYGMIKNPEWGLIGMIGMSLD